MDKAQAADEEDAGVEKLEATAQGLTQTGSQGRIRENLYDEMEEFCQPADKYGLTK